MKVMKNKQLSKKSGAKVPAGGSNVMMGRQYTGPQKPGVTSQEQSKSGKWAKGGGKKMTGQPVKNLKPA